MRAVGFLLGVFDRMFLNFFKVSNLANVVCQGNSKIYHKFHNKKSSELLCSGTHSFSLHQKEIFKK